MLAIKKKTTLEDLWKVELVRPDYARRHWEGVPHALLAETLLEKASAQGFPFASSEFALGTDGAEMHAVFEQPANSSVNLPSGWCVCLAVLTANDQSRSTQALLGVVTGEGVGVPLLKLRRVWKHTNKLKVGECVEEMLIGFIEQGPNLGKILLKLKEKKFSPEEQLQLLGTAGRRKWMPWSRVGRIDKALREKGADNALDLLLEFCRVARMNRTLIQLDTMYKFRKLVLPE